MSVIEVGTTFGAGIFTGRQIHRGRRGELVVLLLIVNAAQAYIFLAFGRLHYGVGGAAAFKQEHHGGNYRISLDLLFAVV